MNRSVSIVLRATLQVLCAIAGMLLGIVVLMGVIYALDRFVNPDTSWYLTNKGWPRADGGVLMYLVLPYLGFAALGAATGLFAFRRVASAVLERG